MHPSQWEENLSDFEVYPWYHALLAAPHITPQPTASRNPPFTNIIQAYTFFSFTLFISTGLRAMQSFHVRTPFLPASSAFLLSPTSQPPNGRSENSVSDNSSNKPVSDDFFNEWHVLVSLGTGLNGPGGIVHGGLAMTLLDSAMAVHAFRAAGAKPVVTTCYEADFKRKIKAPWVFSCRAWLDKRVADVKKDEDGKKEWRVNEMKGRQTGRRFIPGGRWDGECVP